MLKGFVYILLFLSVISAFAPFDPIMPSVALDSSWSLALNQAVSQNLVFGEDLQTTFGPYPSIYSKTYHPDTYHMALLGGALFGISYFALLILFVAGLEWKWLILYVGVLPFLFILPNTILPGAILPDALFFSYIFFLSIVVYRMTLPDSSALHLRKSALNRYIYIFTLIPVGLLLLVKGSVIPYVTLVVTACATLFWISRNRYLALATIVTPVVASLLFWVLAGQPLRALPVYFGNMGKMISGYSDAMSATGSALNITLFLITSATILFLTTKKEFGPLISRLLLFAMFSLFLFVSFKAGFVRHDMHQLIAGASLVIASLSISLLSKSRLRIIILPLTLISWIFIDGNIYSKSPGYFSGLMSLAGGNSDFSEKYEKKLDFINNDYHISKLTGSVDIYSYGQSMLLASKNKWSPRPTVQSFAAYTRYLAVLNEKHLRGANAPDNILFRVETIDNRFPSLDDGRSWPTIINGYELYRYDYYRDISYLKKVERAPKDNFEKGEINIRGELRKEILLPETKGALFAEIDIKPTLFGKILSILYKRPQINIHLTLADGSSRNYRIVSGMVKSGFIISPLIESTTDFVYLNGSSESYLHSKHVKSFAISSTSKLFRSWKRHYGFRLRNVRLSENADLSKIISFNEKRKTLEPDRFVIHKRNCNGRIDLLNGQYPYGKTISASTALSAKGWSAISIKDKKSNGVIYLTLTDEQGITAYIKTDKVPRPDVTRYFKRPVLLDTGYYAHIDISGRKGKYLLGVSHQLDESIEQCVNSQVQLNIF